jgi:hypothetical protein
MFIFARNFLIFDTLLTSIGTGMFSKISPHPGYDTSRSYLPAVMSNSYRGIDKLLTSSEPAVGNM